MSAELRPKEDGEGYQIVEPGQDPVDVSTEDLLKAYEEAGQDITKRTITVQVDGQDRTVTVEEAAKAFEKVAGADKRFAEASDLVKQAESAVTLQKILTKMNQSPDEVTETEFRTLLSGIGVPANQVDEALTMFKAIQSGQLPAGTGNETDGQNDTIQKPIPFDALPRQVQEAVVAQAETQKHLKAQADKQFVEELQAETKKALTSNEFVAKILSEEANGKPIDWEAKDSWARALFAEAWEMVESKVGVRQQQPSPELFQGIAQELRNRLERRSKLGSSTGQDLTSLGPASAMPPSVHLKEPPKRVPVGHEGRSGNIAKRLMAAFYRASQGSKTGE